MRPNRKATLQAAEAVWLSLPADLKNNLARRLAVDMSYPELAEGLGQGLALCVRSDHELYSYLETALHTARLQTTLDTVAETYLETLTKQGSLADHLRPAVAKHLWINAWAELSSRQPLPDLAALEAVFDSLAGTRIAISEAVQKHLNQLAQDLYAAVRHDLAAVLTEGQTPEAPTWLYLGESLPLSVDYTSLACARYLAGHHKPRRDAYGFEELPGFSARSKRVEEVAVKVVPEEARGSSLELLAPPDELKAKTFFAVLALAAEQDRYGGKAHFAVRLSDLMTLLGFRLGENTNSRYYWQYALTVVRYLLVDLPSRVAAMEVAMTGAAQPLIVYERLTLYPRVVHKRSPRDFEAQFLTALRAGDQQRLEALVKDSDFEGLELGVSSDMLSALGIARPMRALERIPKQVFALRGPAFWLAWHTAFLRRWSKGTSKRVHLSEHLHDTTYLTRARPARYKASLKQWWRDIGDLTTLGVLDEPGARLFRFKGGRWRDVSDPISRQLEPAGGRITRQTLEALYVQFALPKARLAELETVRRRAARRKRS